MSFGLARRSNSISAKLSSGSPPWNSILMCGDGDRNVSSSARSAVSSDMSKRLLSALCRETWQYGQECSHRKADDKHVQAGELRQPPVARPSLQRQQLERKLLTDGANDVFAAKTPHRRRIKP